tara:strand:- start:3610 stop:4284 length:675 start_codon:yes stop_codon:yes gene_type:complete
MPVWDKYITSDVKAMYQHYRSEPQIGSTPCLLLIDLYNLSYKGGDLPVSEIIKTNPSGCGEYAHQAIKPTQTLISLFRQLQFPIIFTTRDWQAHSTGTHSTQRQRKNISESDYDIYAAFNYLQDDTLIRKSRASVFFKTELDQIIEDLGIDSIVLGGESTSGCVRASVVDAYSRGLPPVLVQECVFDRNPISHAINLFDMHHKYGHVTSIEEVTELLNSKIREQ